MRSPRVTGTMPGHRILAVVTLEVALRETGANKYDFQRKKETPLYQSCSIC